MEGEIVVGFLGFLMLIVTGWALYGLISPGEALWFWKEKESRFLVFAIWLGAVMFTSALMPETEERAPRQAAAQKQVEEGSPSEAQATGEEKGTAKKAEAPPMDPAAKYMERIRRELDGLSDFDGSQYHNSKEGILMEAVLFTAWAKTIREARNYGLTGEQLDSVRTFRDRVSEIQRREYPRLRDAYGPILRQVLWEHDVTAKTFGSGFRTVQFVGGIFAANRNKKQFQEEMQATFRQLRFKQVRYKWYEGAGYTYWDMNTPDDGVVGEWTDNGWVEARIDGR